MKTLARIVIGATLIYATPLSVVGQQPDAPKIIRLAHKGSRIGVAFSPDSKTLATGADDDQIRLWDVATGKEKRAFRTGRVGAQATQLYYMPDGKSLASTVWSDVQGWAGVVKTWEESSGKEKLVIRGNKGGAALRAVSPDGKFLALLVGGSGKVQLFDIAKDRALHIFPAPAAVDSAIFSWDGKWLATASGGGKVQLWDVASGKQVREIHAKQIVWSGSQAVAFTPDKKILATASAKVRLWNTATGEEIAALGPENETQSHIAISADGRFLASSNMSLGPLRLWDLKTYKVVHSWDVNAYSSLAISPDGNWLAFSDWSDSGVGLIKIGAAK